MFTFLVGSNLGCGVIKRWEYFSRCTFDGIVGRRSIVDKASAYGAQGQGIKSRSFSFFFLGQRLTNLNASLLSLTMHDAHGRIRKARPANRKRRTGRRFRNGLRDSRKDELVRLFRMTWREHEHAANQAYNMYVLCECLIRLKIYHGW